MIICKDCGNSAESVDGFCSSCGSLLEWSGQQVPGASRATATLGTRQPAAERARPEPLPAAAEEAQAGPYCMTCGVRNPPGRTFCRSCGATLRLDGAAAGHRSGWWRRMLVRLRGRPLTGDTAAGDTAPGPDAGPEPAGSLAASGGAGPIPGLRSVPRQAHWPGGHGPGGHGASGHGTGAVRRIRQARPSRWAYALRYSPVFVVVAAVGIGFSPAREWALVHVLHLKQDISKDIGRKYAQQFALSATASSAAPGHAAGLAVDNSAGTFWLTRGPGAGASITIKFATPVKIDQIGLLSGEPGTAYLTQARPEVVVVTSGQDPPVTVTFSDSQAFQKQAVSLRDVTTLTLTIKSAYAGQHGEAVAIRGLQFYDLVGGSG